MNAKRIVSFFCLGFVPPFISHVSVFLLAMALTFDLMRVSAMPLKIAKGVVLFTEARGRFFLSKHDLNVNQKIVLVMVASSESKDVCVIPGVEGRIVQREKDTILAMSQTAFLEMGKLLDPSKIYGWMLAEEVQNVDVCKTDFSISYSR